MNPGGGQSYRVRLVSAIDVRMAQVHVLRSVPPQGWQADDLQRVVALGNLG